MVGRALRAKAQVKRNDSPEWKRLSAELKEADGLYLKYGYLGDGEAYEDGMTAPRLGAVHEFGAPEVHVPARPHMGPAFDQNRERYVGLLASGLSRWYSGRQTLKQTLGLLGTVMVSDVRGLITEGSGISPPNAPSTLARKLARGARNATARKKAGGPGAEDGPRPLVDTGRMVAALTYVVVSGKGNKPKE